MTKNLTYKSTHWIYSEPSRKKKKTNKKFAFFISIFTKLVYYSLGFGKKFFTIFNAVCDKDIHFIL